jgi:Beige/BEACH domain.
VRQELAHWIDFVFGYKQSGSEAVEAVNVFHPATYSGNQAPLLDQVEARARQTMIETYGQTPLQLFSSPHPLPLAELVRPEEEERRAAACPGLLVPTVTGLQYGSYVGAAGQPSPTVVWQQSQGVTVSSLVRLETNEMIGLPARHLLLGRYTAGRSLGQIYSGLQVVASHLVSWGHTDNTLRLRQAGDSDSQYWADLPWDSVTTGQSQPRVPAVWLGHQSGLISVYPLRQTGRAAPSLEAPPLSARPL